MRVYLDNCVFNRPFDDQTKLIVSLQTQAKLAIQERIRGGSLDLTWSYILDFENDANPFEERRGFVSSWKAFASRDIEESAVVLSWADELAGRGLRPKDSLHLACSREADCDFFITTDNRILREKTYGRTRIVDPVAFLSETEA